MVWSCTLRASDNSAAVGRNVHAGDKLVVPLQLVLDLEDIAYSAVEVDGGLARNSYQLTVRREGMVRNWVVEEVVDFWSCHGEMWL